MNRTTLCAAVLVPAFLAAGCTVTVDSQGQILHEEKRFTVSGTPSVNATTFDGSIQVRAWDNADVLVEIEKRGPTRAALEQIEVHTAQDGNTVTVEARRPHRRSVHVFGLNMSPTARLIVWVPKHADVRARSGDGCVNVSGKLAVVRLHTGDGSIVYRADPGTKMNDDWDITTGDGGVTLYLPSDFGAELDAHTGDGSIRNDLDLTGSVDNSRRTVRGRLGPGGRQLRIRTGDGSIRLKSS